jgi:hypothetical protein
LIFRRRKPQKSLQNDVIGPRSSVDRAAVS